MDLVERRALIAKFNGVYFEDCQLGNDSHVLKDHGAIGITLNEAINYKVHERVTRKQIILK